MVLGHSLAELLLDLLTDHPDLSDLRDAARQLDQYYIPTRYPNGLPGGVPAQAFTPRQAAEAVAYARQLVARAGTALGILEPSAHHSTRDADGRAHPWRKRARTFPRKRRGAWRATRAGW